MFGHALRTSFLGIVMLAATLGCAEETVRRTFSGTVSIPGAPPLAELAIDAQTLDGRRAGSGYVGPTGDFMLEADVPASAEVILLGAAAYANPDLRAYAVVHLGVDTVVAALGEDGAAPSQPFVTALDSQSTATAILMTAAGRLDMPPDDFARRHAGPVGRLSDAMQANPVSLCSVGATPVTSAPWDSLSSAVREVAALEVTRPSSVPLLNTIRAHATNTAQPVEWRLGAAQREISATVFSTNLPRLRLNLDTPIGLIPLALQRIGIYAITGEDLVDLNDRPLTLTELDQLAAMAGATRWGNCREKAYLAAYAASFVPEVKQITILGVFVKNVGEHAVALACTEGPEVYDISKYESFSQLIPGNGKTCYVIDPWAPATYDAPAGTGHVALFDHDYIQRASWEQAYVNKPIRLTPPSTPPFNHLEVGRPGNVMQVCKNSQGVSCSALPPPPDPGVGDVIDAVTQEVLGPEATSDTAPIDTGPTCPMYEPNGLECGASLAGCIEGFYCSRETIACEQTECPEGSGRTYTLECCCNCWDDQSKRNVYDPCRPGFLLRCE